MKNNIHKEEIFFYFIESHNKGVKNELYINDKNNTFLGPLNIEEKFEKQMSNKNTIEITIYSFKIFFSKIKNVKKNKPIIKIILKEENKNKFETKIDIQEIEKDRDYFLYNFKLESSKFLIIDKFCQSSFKLIDSELFDLYLNFIKNKFNKGENKQKKIDDLMYYTHKKLLEKKNYNYYFFADILIESLDNKENCLKLLNLYKKEKFEINYVLFNEERMKQIKSELNEIPKNIKLLFDYIKGENDESTLNLNIISFFFYFNYYYQKEQINKMVEIKEINFYVYDILSNNKLENLFLTKKAINILFKYTINYDDVQQLFNYNNNFLDLLEILNDNKKIIAKYYKMDKNNKNKFIKINNFIMPNKNDNLNEIFKKIKEIISYENKTYAFFLYFSDTIFNKYIEINEDNLDNIIIIYQIAKYIKENDQISGIKTTDKLLDILHNKGYILIENNILPNTEILFYLENDELYKNELYLNQFFTIIEYINIDEINNDFILKWKAINWESMYHKKKNIFYQIICNSLKDIKNFNNLFILFGEEEDDKMNYEKEFVNDLLYSFVKLFVTCNENVCESTAEVAIKLIYLCLNNAIDSSPLINCIKTNNILKAEIYNKLINKENNKYSESFTIKIFNLFKDNLENSDDYYPLLLFIIKNSKNLKKETISFLNSNYSLRKDDFFYLIENNKLKIYKELLNYKFLEKGELAESNYLDINNQIDKEIRDGTIEFYYIYNFYSENKEDILYERLLLITRNNNSIVNEYKKIIEEHMTKIKPIIKDDIIYKYLNTIFPESQKKVINKLKEIKKKILEKNLIYYQTFEKDYLEIKNQFIKDATENLKYINNKAFINMYNYLKTTNKDENIIFLKSKEYLNLLKIIIEDNNLKKTKYDDLKKFMKIIIKTKKDVKELIDDIKIIISDFNIKTKVVPEKLSEDLLLLSESEKYITIIGAIIDFINWTKGTKTYFYSVLNNMYNNLNKTYDINSIKLIIEIFEGYKIDINGNFIKILIKLKNKKEERDFLFKNHPEMMFKKIKDANKDNNNIFFGFDKAILLIKKYTDNSSSKKWKDKEIIDDFKNRINNNDEIFCSFKNYFDKYKVFKDNF